jgi:hypothetical protein
MPLLSRDFPLKNLIHPEQKLEGLQFFKLTINVYYIVINVNATVYQSAHFLYKEYYFYVMEPS